MTALLLLLPLALASASQRRGTTCWEGTFTYERCCLPNPESHEECWDLQFTPARCCVMNREEDANLASSPLLPGSAIGCWTGAFAYEDCCLPVPDMNLQCFDDWFTPARCCGEASIACPQRGPDPAYHDIERFFDLYKTDKGNTRHKYHKLYGSVLESYREFSKLVVEVGIGTEALMKYPAGQGLRAWRDFFPHAQVVGLDIDPAASILGDDRILTITPVDTTEPWSVIDKLSSIKQGSVDIIIDDGAHDPVLQGRTLSAMWSFLRDGGIYLIEDLEYKYGDIMPPDNLRYLGYGASHHLCAMSMKKPFVFGSLEAKDAAHGLSVRPTETNYTPVGLESVLSKNGVFYAALKPGHEISNIIVLPKNWPQQDKPFNSMTGNYHIVYNVLLRNASVRRVVAQLPAQVESWREALPSTRVEQGPAVDGCDVDVLVASARSPLLETTLRDFGRVRRGGFLFVEDLAFSFCSGTPDPALLGPLARAIADANPDWFYAMTQDDWPLDDIPDYKLLVVRKK